MSKHTPERLTYSAKLSGSENHRGFRIFNAEGFAIAEVQPLDEDGVQGEVYARQFAAAPDMLEALQSLTHSLELGDMFHDDQRAAFAAARAAIAKATGEQQ